MCKSKNYRAKRKVFCFYWILAPNQQLGDSHFKCDGRRCEHLTGRNHRKLRECAVNLTQESIPIIPMATPKPRGKLIDTALFQRVSALPILKSSVRSVHGSHESQTILTRPSTAPEGSRKRMDADSISTGTRNTSPTKSSSNPSLQNPTLSSSVPSHVKAKGKWTGRRKGKSKNADNEVVAAYRK